MMLKEMSRSKPVQVWFAAVVLVAVASVALGTPVTIATGTTLLALSLIPLAVVLLLWPGVRSQTAADVLHDTHRRD
jgi:hypothetical protein